MIRLTTHISLKSVALESRKIRRANHGSKHWKIWLFVWFQQLQQKLWVDGWVASFCSTISQVSFLTLKHKFQAAVPVLCWYFFFFKLHEKAIVKKNIYSHLLAKIYDTFSEGMLNKPGVICLNMKRYSK